MRLIIPIYESLESDLLKNKQELEILIDSLLELFSNANFKMSKTVNGMNFNNKINDIYVSFYVDDKLNYKGYVTTNDLESGSNYSVKGNYESVINSANKIINAFRSEL